MGYLKQPYKNLVCLVVVYKTSCLASFVQKAKPDFYKSNGWKLHEIKVIVIRVVSYMGLR